MERRVRPRSVHLRRGEITDFIAAVDVRDGEKSKTLNHALEKWRNS